MEERKNGERGVVFSLKKTKTKKGENKKKKKKKNRARGEMRKGESRTKDQESWSDLSVSRRT